MKRGIRRVPALWRASRLLRRWYHARSDAYPDWPAILASEPERWENARRSAAGGPRVLMASSIGSYAHAVTLESALAAALTFRGAEVHTLLCDAALPACAECEASLYPNLARFVRKGPQADLCRDCLWPAERVYRSLGLTVHRYSDWLFPDDKAQAREIAASVPFGAIQGYVRDGIAIGEHAYAGALRFFASGSLDDEPQGEAVLRRYLESALLTATATTRLLRGVGFTAAVFTHGIYVPWGLVGAVARREEVRVATWNVAYRKRRFIFSHDDTYHHTLMTEPRAHWESLVLSETQERELMQYLASRREGMFDWIVFNRARKDDPKELAARIGLDPSKPVIGLLTNVSWDAQLHYPANAFPNMLEWLVRTCEYFATRPDLQLLIRVHPAEISGFPPSRQPILRELARRLPQLAAEHPRGAAGEPDEHLRPDVAVQRRHHLRHQDGRGADQRGAAGDRGGGGLDPEQGTDPRRELARGVHPAPRPAAVRPGPRAGTAGPGAALRLSFLLQPDDSAAVHRTQGRLPDLPAEAGAPAAAAPRGVGRPRHAL